MSPKMSNSSRPLPAAKPEETGFSPERLARIGPGLQKIVDSRLIPNVVTLAARHGQIVHYEARGYLDVESRKPAPKDTIYRLWSNTKPITGAATMICVEDGLLDLDDPVSKYIPAFKNQVVRAAGAQARSGARNVSMGMTPTVPAERDITIRDCLRNTTGLATMRNAPIQYLAEFGQVYPQSCWFGDMGKSSSIREAVDALAKLPLDFQPGTQFVYHIGYTVMSVVLETVTGKTLEEFYQERIFRPLGMQDTSFYLPEDKLDRFTTCYRPVYEKGEWKIVVEEKPEDSEKVKGPRKYFEAGGGAGGVLSTVGDYARFAQMLLNGGELDGVRILGRKTVELMTSSHTGENIYVMPSGDGFGFGMGVGVYKGSTPPLLRSPGTYGWDGIGGTNYFADPKEGLVCVCFSQVMRAKGLPGFNYTGEFERLVYQALV